MLAQGHSLETIRGLPFSLRSRLWRLYMAGQAGPVQAAHMQLQLLGIQRLLLQLGGGKPRGNVPTFRSMFPELAAICGKGTPTFGFGES